MFPGCVPFKIVSDSPTLHSRWLLFFKVMIIFLWNLLQYHSIVRWAIQAQWAEPLVEFSFSVYSQELHVNLQEVFNNPDHFKIKYLVLRLPQLFMHYQFYWQVNKKNCWCYIYILSEKSDFIIEQIMIKGK